MGDIAFQCYKSIVVQRGSGLGGGEVGRLGNKHAKRINLQITFNTRTIN